MPELGLGHAVGILGATEAELDGAVPVPLFRTDVRHHVRLGDDDRRRHDRAVFLEVLEHAELATEEHRLLKGRGSVGRLCLIVLLFHFRLVGHLFCL